MGALDGLIQPMDVLFVCFAVYVIMGITLVAMGAVYMAETGAAGATGGSLLFIGDSDSPPQRVVPSARYAESPVFCGVAAARPPPPTTHVARRHRYAGRRQLGAVCQLR